MSRVSKKTRASAPRHPASEPRWSPLCPCLRERRVLALPTGCREDREKDVGWWSSTSLCSRPVVMLGAGGEHPSRGPWRRLAASPRGPAGSVRAVRTGRLWRRQLWGRLCVGGHEFSLPPQPEVSCLPLLCPPRAPLSVLRGRGPQNGAWRAPQRTRTHEPFCRSLPLFGGKGRETRLFQ